MIDLIVSGLAGASAAGSEAGGGAWAQAGTALASNQQRTLERFIAGSSLASRRRRTRTGRRRGRRVHVNEGGGHAGSGDGVGDGLVGARGDLDVAGVHDAREEYA